MTGINNPTRATRILAGGIAVLGAAALGVGTAAPASATVTSAKIQNSALFGSQDGKYGVGCGYGVVAEVTGTENVIFKANGAQFASEKPNGGKATGFWVPTATGKYTITVTQGNEYTVGTFTVQQGFYTGSSCVVF
ncbi:hypothetical protein ACWDTD_19770 [Gordonia sp. NPDC003425]